MVSKLKAIKKSLYEGITTALNTTTPPHNLSEQTTRITQGITLYKQNKVKLTEITPHLVKFKVEDLEGKEHDVTLEHGKIWTCDCADHSFRLSFCQEIYAAILFLAILKD